MSTDEINALAVVFAVAVVDEIERRRSVTTRPMLTIAEYAKAIGASKKTVGRWCRAGKIAGADKPGRDWRIPASVLDGDEEIVKAEAGRLLRLAKSA